MFHEFIEGLMHALGSWGYPGIFVLMAMESSLFPVPSELVMIPAGYLASRGVMNFWVAWFLGTVGSLVGALANYYLSMYLGRPIIVKLCRWFAISEHHLEKVETYFAKHGEISTFVGRLLPVIRHLISIPAGLARMNVWKMSSYTLLGAGLWVFVLTGIGYVAGQNEGAIHELLQKSGVLITLFVVLLVIGYIYYHRVTSRMVHTIEVPAEEHIGADKELYHLLLTAHQGIKKRDTVRLMSSEGEMIGEFRVERVVHAAGAALEKILEQYGDKLKGERKNKAYWEQVWNNISMIDVANDLSIVVMKA